MRIKPLTFREGVGVGPAVRALRLRQGQHQPAELAALGAHAADRSPCAVRRQPLEPIGADDPALAAMRAEQEAVVPGELGSPIQAALAFPMMHQAALAGFMLLGQKPTGEDYRPDEIEVLTWAAQQVGIDLQAIRVRDLERTNIRLAERNQTLTELLTSTAAKV